jgi:hypothetical protein
MMTLAKATVPMTHGCERARLLALLDIAAPTGDVAAGGCDTAMPTLLTLPA